MVVFLGHSCAPDLERPAIVGGAIPVNALDDDDGRVRWARSPLHPHAARIMRGNAQSELAIRPNRLSRSAISSFVSVCVSLLARSRGANAMEGV